jgi:hypothetical protein
VVPVPGFFLTGGLGGVGVLATALIADGAAGAGVGAAGWAASAPSNRCNRFRSSPANLDFTDLAMTLITFFRASTTREILFSNIRAIIAFH